MRDLKEESRQTFDSQAAQYDKGIDGKHARQAYPVIIEVIKGFAPKTVLDLGCGTAALLERVLKIESIATAYGLDLSEKMLEQARNKLIRATLVQGDSEHLPFENNSFDVVYCNDSFHHYPNPRAVLAEVKRVLRQEGKLILCDPYQQPGALWITNFILRLTNTGNVKLYSKKELCSLASECFQNVVWRKVGSTSHMIYCEK